jgi:hypothetical protein
MGKGQECAVPTERKETSPPLSLTFHIILVVSLSLLNLRRKLMSSARTMARVPAGPVHPSLPSCANISMESTGPRPTAEAGQSNAVIRLAVLSFVFIQDRLFSYKAFQLLDLLRRRKSRKL